MVKRACLLVHGLQQWLGVHGEVCVDGSTWLNAERHTAIGGGKEASKCLGRICRLQASCDIAVESTY